MSRVHPHRRPKKVRRPQLQVQAFDERIMPATTVGISNGILTVNAGAQRSDIIVNDHGNGQIKVRDNIARSVTTWTAADVDRIVFIGGPLRDRFENTSSKPSTANGGPGDDTLMGGNSADLFMGSAGRDVYTGGGGDDVLIRNGYRVNFKDASDKNAVVGLFSGRLTPAELKAEGDLHVYLVGDRLMLSGPTGAGFALRSNWQMSESGGEMKFSTDSTIMLESSWGDIPLPNLGDRIHVVCDTTQFDGVGVFDSVRWGGVDVTFSSPTGSYATQLENFTGGQVGLPGVSWGIALGADVGDDAAPLNAAVPYLYATAQSGYSFEYENVSLGTEDSYSATFAFAPGDGTIYASITGLPVIGDFALGISTNGYLPYVPARIPTGAVDPNILGHFYLRGAVSLDDIGAPLDVGGDLVLDLDANDNGVLLGGALSAERITEIADVFQGSLSSVTSLLARATTILRDVQIGINTNLDLSFHGLGLSLSRSSLWLTPNEIAFRAATSNPFQGIPYLENVPTPNGIDVQGFHRRGGVWRASFNAEAGIPGVFGGLSAEAGSHLNGIRVSAFVTGSLPMVGGFNIRLTGTVLTNGNFVLTGTTTVDVGPIDGTLLLSLSRINGRMRISWRIL